MVIEIFSLENIITLNLFSLCTKCSQQVMQMVWKRGVKINNQQCQYCVVLCYSKLWAKTGCTCAHTLLQIDNDFAIDI